MHGSIHLSQISAIHSMAFHQPPSPHFLLDEQQPSDLLCDQLVPHAGQQSLHLVPCVWEDVLQLDCPIHGYYDYIEGFIVWSPNMANRAHHDLRDHHATVMKYSSPVTVLHTPSIQILNAQHRLEWSVRDAPTSDQIDKSDDSDRNRTSSSTERRGASQSSLLHPDFAITTSRRDSDTSDSSGGTGLAKQFVKLPYPYTSKLLVVGEVTSKGTRDTDLGYKWAAYARSGVPMYIILDRGLEEESERVIVGSIAHFSDAEKSTSGDVLAPAASRSRRGSPTPAYYRKEYRSQDIVDCLHYAHLEKTAAQLLDVRLMRRLAGKLRNEQWSNAERTKIAEQNARDERRKREEAERKREESERKYREERRKREEAERKYRDERWQREEAERTDSDERRKREQLEEWLTKIELEREEKRRQRKASGERNRETRTVGEGASSNQSRNEKKASSSSTSSPKKDSPEYKKSRKI